MKASGIAYTIIRAAPLMDVMVFLFGEPIAQADRAHLRQRHQPDQLHRGRKRRPPRRPRPARSACPQPHPHHRRSRTRSTRQIAETVAKTTGKPLAIRAFPLPMMRVMKLVLRVFNPVFARRIEQMIVLDTTSQLG